MDRRTFIKNGAALSTLTVLKPDLVFKSKNNSVIRIGFIGCGGRGTGVLTIMSAHTNIHVVALADIFEDQLGKAEKAMNDLNRKKGFANISKENIYVGSDAYLRLLENQHIDAVLISTPAYAHPDILEAAVAAGKHVFCEKPAAIDAFGCKQIGRVSASINQKLSAVIGFQLRYAPPYVEMMKRIKRGDIGDIITAQLYYLSSNTSTVDCRGISPDECRVRNHFQFQELSGGIYLDQAIHMIDICNWILGTTPLHAIGLGGRKGKPDFGNSWSNYQVIYEYPDDIHVSVHATQIGNVFGDVCIRFVGTKGIAEANYDGGVFIRGEHEWDSGILRSQSDLSPELIAQGMSASSIGEADKNKGISFIHSIETGNYINQLQTGCDSTLSAILGREAAIKQEKVTWEEINLHAQRINPNIDLKQFDK